jgi:large subunit ribosomal protein L19
MKARLYYLRGRTGKAAVAIKEKDRAAEIHAQHEAEKAARAAAQTAAAPAAAPAATS